jgi:hypothetical protein
MTRTKNQPLGCLLYLLQAQCRQRSNSWLGKVLAFAANRSRLRKMTFATYVIVGGFHPGSLKDALKMFMTFLSIIFQTGSLSMDIRSAMNQLQNVLMLCSSMVRGPEKHFVF